MLPADDYRKTPHPASDMPQRAIRLDVAFDAYSAAKARPGASQALLDPLLEAAKLYGDAVCDRKLGNVDADVVQEALIDISQRLDGFQGKSKFSSWAYRIVYRRCQDKLREVQREGRYGGESLEDLQQDIVDEKLPKLEGSEELISAALAKLDEDKRQVVQLRLDGVSYAEIASRLGISESLAEWRWRKALEELRDASG